MLRLVTWNTNRRVGKARDQAQALLDRNPSFVGLQEVTASTAPILADALAQGGLSEWRSTVANIQEGPRALGVLIGSRFLIHERPPLPGPWPEKVLSCAIETPLGLIDIHVVHVPPGSSNHWIKVEVLEGIWHGLRERCSLRAILCGDINAPQAEFPTGEVVTWAQTVSGNGKARLHKQFRGQPALRWDAAERNILSGLSACAMSDAFRKLHGYGMPAWSWRLSRKGKSFDRRFDHVSLSESLCPMRAEYWVRRSLAGLGS
jgi:exonuclease III